MTSWGYWLLISYFLQDSMWTSKVTICLLEPLCLSFSLGTAPTYESPPSKRSSLFGKFQLKCWFSSGATATWVSSPAPLLALVGFCQGVVCLQPLSMWVVVYSSLASKIIPLFPFYYFIVTMDLLIIMQHSYHVKGIVKERKKNKCLKQ